MIIPTSSRTVWKRFRPGVLCLRFPQAGHFWENKAKSDPSVSSTQGILSLAPSLPLSPLKQMLIFSRNQRTNTIGNNTSDSSTATTARRSYFTNGEASKKEDPYAVLGLQWGDGATTAEIRQAFRERAKALHPDVVDTSVMTTEEAHEEFQKLVRAYESLLKHVRAGDHCGDTEEWREALWRQSDRIALDRTDVAGVARKRPAKSAQTEGRYGRELGHPGGKGIAVAREEYLSEGGDGNGKKLRSSSVGRGQSKWVKKKPKAQYKEWQPSR